MELYPTASYNIFNRVKLHFSISAKEKCKEIHKSCLGPGTNEKALIQIIGSQPPNERNLIALRYRQKYDQNLADLVEKETSGDFGYLLHLLTLPLPEAEAFVLHNAIHGFGTSEKLIFPIVLGRTNNELEILKQTYLNLYGKDLASTMESELSGEFRKVIVGSLQSPALEYRSSVHTAAKAEEDADRLYQAGQAKLLSKDEDTFFAIILLSPVKHLENINIIYTQKYGNDIFTAIEKEFRFHRSTKKALMFHVGLLLKGAEAITDHIEHTMSGLKTNEKDLSCSIVRYQCRMPEIRVVYQQKYHKSLEDRISGDTSGDYQKLLLEIIQAPIDQAQP
ncbi:hypothetical protein ABG067_001312 [Albugo candida]|uniref:Annexin n=1 Tax=Albugo candida TaxID=65357 RepID=A0A024G874_9STRA|nr:unnamed protein product [Albugo candida]|eukprot:CCI42517.1 unnamed protein product [Albugo candida]